MQTLALPADRFIGGTLPLYADVTLVTAEHHGHVTLSPDLHFGFAAAEPTVPLTMDEFERAALDYPILFFGPTRRALAITSLDPAGNLFIDGYGDYCVGAYVPAYLRRHPFVLVDDVATNSLVLAMDERSRRLTIDGPAAQRLFVDGQPSDVTRNVVAFCEEYRSAQARTERLVELLDELDLFEIRQAHHRPRRPDGTTGEAVLLLDYAAVDRRRFEALGDAAIAELRAIQGLGPVYAHLASAANWERLALAG